MADLVMQILLSLTILVAVGILGHLPYSVSGMSPQWITAAMAGVVMVSTFYQALYQHRIKEELRHLNRMLSGEEEMHHGFRGTMERLRTLVREFNDERQREEMAAG